MFGSASGWRGGARRRSVPTRLRSWRAMLAAAMSPSANRTPRASRRPSSPPRQRWFVDPGTWDAERVIDACREWATRTGAPPTYYDWGPQERVPPGSTPVLAAVWESEHPAWPSTAVVHRHLGGFRAMLLAAGFAAPAPIEIPFAERVQRAQQLRADGLSWAEIGELLGVGADTARRYVNAHSCECGEPILARDARLCRRCSSRHRTRWGRVFTEPEIIAAIRLWAKLEGRAPAIVDWRPADQGGHPRWERDCPRFPPRSHVTRRFGSWNAALQAAGFDRPRPRGMERSRNPGAAARVGQRAGVRAVVGRVGRQPRPGCHLPPLWRLERSAPPGRPRAAIRATTVDR